MSHFGVSRQNSTEVHCQALASLDLSVISDISGVTVCEDLSRKLVAPETRKVDDDKVVTDCQRAKKGTENNEEDPARSYDACSPDPPGFDRGICFSGKSRG